MTNDVSQPKHVLTKQEATPLVIAIYEGYFGNSNQMIYNDQHIVKPLIDEAVKEGQLEIADLVDSIDNYMQLIKAGKYENLDELLAIKSDDTTKEKELQEAAEGTKFEQPAKRIAKVIGRIREDVETAEAGREIDWAGSLEVIKEARLRHLKHPAFFTMAERLGQWNKNQSSQESTR